MIQFKITLEHINSDDLTKIWQMRDYLKQLIGNDIHKNVPQYKPHFVDVEYIDPYDYDSGY